MSNIYFYLKIIGDSFTTYIFEMQSDKSNTSYSREYSFVCLF